MTVLQIIILALMGEAIWETAKMTWQEGKISIDRVGAIIVCLVLSIGAGLDLFQLVEIPLRIPYVGMIFTGLLISRGANFVHDLYKKIQPGQ